MGEVEGMSREAAVIAELSTKAHEGDEQAGDELIAVLSRILAETDPCACRCECFCTCGRG